jgi:NDP-sugar pyrophosphorylase family protein
MRQAVILAGGRGTRLRPLTFSLPKPLVPLGERPVLDILLGQLKRAGVEEAVISTGYMASLLEAFCGDGSRWGLKVRYAREEAPLHTAGPLAMIDGLDEDFLVANGDVLTTLDFKALWRAHRAAGAAATIAVCERRVPVDFGVVETGPGGELARYSEKPSLSYMVSMGINLLNRRCLKHIRRGEALGMPDLLLRAKAAGEKVMCHAGAADWLDIGRPEDYEAAQEKVRQAPEKYFPDAR